MSSAPGAGRDPAPPPAFADAHCHPLGPADAALAAFYGAKIPPAGRAGAGPEGAAPSGPVLPRRLGDGSIAIASRAEARGCLRLFADLPAAVRAELARGLAGTAARAAAAGARLLAVPAAGCGEGRRNRLLYRLLRRAAGGAFPADAPRAVFGFGCHPRGALSFDPGEFEAEAAFMTARPGGTFVGEIGIDRRLAASVPLARQEEAFRIQLGYAAARGLPVSIHCVGGAGEVLRALRAAGPVAGAIHAFAGGPELAGQYLRRGLKLGIGPALLSPRAGPLREAVRRAGAGALVLETDFPYARLAPDGSDGGFYGAGRPGLVPAEPAFLPLVLARVAGLLGLDPETASARLWENAAALFGGARERSAGAGV